uniref:Sodium channel modifier 1 n=1 Tax=Helianthus annuus TaxID=4232 RepID=A0A251VE71_HELAN
MTVVDDLLLDAAGDQSSSYRKLSSGKYACLLCPHTPVFDTPVILSMHMKSRRHLAAESRLKQNEEERQNEMNKRIALSLESTSTSKTECRERELKFIEAGWKRDCHGGWFRDENVEFDSDEEDPNEYYLANGK